MKPESRCSYSNNLIKSKNYITVNLKNKKGIKLCEENKTECLIIGDIETLSKSIGKVNKAIIGIEEENIAKQIQKINYGGESIG